MNASWNDDNNNNMFSHQYSTTFDNEYHDDVLLSDDDAIYPSRTDLNAIRIPQCDDVFVGNRSSDATSRIARSRSSSSPATAVKDPDSKPSPVFNYDEYAPLSASTRILKAPPPRPGQSAKSHHSSPPPDLKKPSPINGSSSHHHHRQQRANSNSYCHQQQQQHKVHHQTSNHHSSSTTRTSSSSRPRLTNRCVSPSPAPDLQKTVPPSHRSVGSDSSRAINAAFDKNSYHSNSHHSRLSNNSNNSMHNSCTRHKGEVIKDTSSYGSEYPSCNKDYSYHSHHHHQAPLPPPAPIQKPASLPRATIEVSPGSYLPLYGSAETREAVKADRLLQAHCFACDETIYTLDLATYVVCPDCRVIWPMMMMTTTQEQEEQEDVDRTPSVGLGLTEADRQEVLMKAALEAQREHSYHSRGGGGGGNGGSSHHRRHYNHHQYVR